MLNVGVIGLKGVYDNTI